MPLYFFLTSRCLNRLFNPFRILQKNLGIACEEAVFYVTCFATPKERHSELAVFIAAATNPLPPVGYPFFPFPTLTFHMSLANIHFCKTVTKEK